jgi:hypothetical protein
VFSKHAGGFLCHVLQRAAWQTFLIYHLYGKRLGNSLEMTRRNEIQLVRPQTPTLPLLNAAREPIPDPTFMMRTDGT